MEKIDKIEQIAFSIKDIILLNYGTMDKQCKRSAILLDMVLNKMGYKSWIEAGIININGNINTGHVWNIIILNKKKYILDISLEQFQQYFMVSIPNIILGEEKQITKQFFYKKDLLGKYEYKRIDISENLISQVCKTLNIEI